MGGSPEWPSWVVCSVGGLDPDVFPYTYLDVNVAIDAPPGTLLEIRMTLGASEHDPVPGNNVRSIPYRVPLPVP